MTKKKPKPSPRWSIDALAVINALQAHVTGKKKLSASQVEVALTLLEKRMPDAVRPRRPPRRPSGDQEDTGTLQDLA
ncbi:MAG: hypothetical protein ACAH83_18475 [Alphaproteobacteria bacterium]